MACKNEKNRKAVERQKKAIRLLRIVGDGRWEAIRQFLDHAAAGIYGGQNSPCAIRAREILEMECAETLHGLAWSPGETQRVRQLLDEGLDYGQIAAKLDRPVAGVDHIVGRMGWRKARAPRLSEDERRRIVHLTKAGHSCGEIAHMMDRGEATIRRHFKQSGLEKEYRKQSPISAKEKVRARQLRASGMKWDDITAKMGRSFSAIRPAVGRDPLGRERPGSKYNGKHTPAAVAGDLREGGPLIQNPSGGRPACF